MPIPVPNLLCLTDTAGYVPALSQYYSGQIHYIEHIDSIPSYLSPENKTLLLLDFATASQYAQQLEPVYMHYPRCQSVIIQAQEQVTTSQLLNLGRLKALFYENESLQTLYAGIAQAGQGQFCLPEPIAIQLLSYYQSVIIRHGKPHLHNLSPRETDVLRLLKSGASNSYLADELFISEFTIKSHLYKIFKKLGIKNRAQAIEWAHKFLP